MNKKWIAVVGSTRKGKNTDLLVDYVIEGLSSNNIQAEKFYLGANITSCTGCEKCMSTGICAIQDGISEVMEHMKTANGYIFASPSYNYNMTAQMKALIDRTFCLNDYSTGWKSRLSNKKAIIVGTCAGKTKESMGYTTEGIRKPLSELGIKIIDTIEYYNTKQVPVIENIDIRDETIERIKKLNNILYEENSL